MWPETQLGTLTCPETRPHHHHHWGVSRRRACVPSTTPAHKRARVRTPISARRAGSPVRWHLAVRRRCLGSCRRPRPRPRVPRLWFLRGRELQVRKAAANGRALRTGCAQRRQRTGAPSPHPRSAGNPHKPAAAGAPLPGSVPERARREAPPAASAPSGPAQPRRPTDTHGPPSRPQEPKVCAAPTPSLQRAHSGGPPPAPGTCGGAGTDTSAAAGSRPVARGGGRLQPGPGAGGRSACMARGSGAEAAAARADARDAAPGRAGGAADPRPGSTAGRAALPRSCDLPRPLRAAPPPARAHWSARCINILRWTVARASRAPIGLRSEAPPRAGCSRAGRG